MTQSFISYNPQGQATSFVGPDATACYAAAVLRSAIALHRTCGMVPTRGMTITKMLRRTSQITGKSYRRGEHAKAEADLKVWIDTMKLALPEERSL